MNVKLFWVTLLISCYSLSNTLCQYYYGPRKEELSIIHTALYKHVNKKDITESYSHKALLHFTEILDPNKVLFYENEIKELKTMSLEDIGHLHNQVMSQNERSFHQNMQSAAAQRMQFLLFSVKTNKTVRNEVLRRISMIDPNNLESRPTVYPKDKVESLNYFITYMAEYAASLKYHLEKNDGTTISEREALVMAIRMIRHDFMSEGYLYSSNFLPTLIAKSYIDKLDAHSDLFLPKEHQYFHNQLLRGEFYGLDIIPLPNFKGVEVHTVNKGGGSEDAGLRKGDIITHVKSENNQNILNSKSEWILTRNIDSQYLSNEIFAGLENSSINIRILRDGKYLEKTIYRKLVSKGESSLRLEILPSINGNIAYIKLDMFYNGSAKHLAEKLREAKRNKTQGLVLDLRGNGGGSTLEMARILGLFVHEGPAMIYKDNNETKIFDIVQPENLDRKLFGKNPW